MEDKKEGYGSLKNDDGRIYIGNWKNDQFHGKGILIDLLGNEVGGEWDEGEKIF